jgi:subtilisin family serine protease
MPSLANLTVTVEDSTASPVTAATVTLLLADSKERVRLTESESVSGQYAATGLQPGEYDVQLSRRGFLKDAYRRRLRPGRNSLGVVMGRRGELYYLAAGLKIYFRPVEDRVLLAAYGPDADRRLESATRERSMELGSERREGAARDATMRVVATPGEIGPRGPFSQDLVALGRQLESEGLEVVPALLVKRGAGPPQGLTQELVVQFAPGVDESEVRRIASDAGLEVRRRVTSTPNGYLLRDPDGPSYEMLSVAAGLVEEDAVMTAEPQLLMELENDAFTPNDPLYNVQTYLPLVQADDGWEELGDFLGDDQRGGSPEVCIAVFDPDGVTPNHPDLTAALSNGSVKLVTSFSFRAMAAQTVAALGGDHGTQCAGTATAAFHDNRGTAGVAANCRLIGARIPSPATDVMMADAFLWAAGIDNGNTTPGFPALPAQPADVISNSWGASNAALSTVLRNAFDRLTDDARDGRGCVVTFSTGNLGYMQFSNVRRFAAYARNLAVGASINANPTSPVTSSQADPNGNTANLVATVDTRAFYNPFGPEMDVVAPSHTCYDNNGNLVDPTTSTVRVGNGGLDGCPGAAVCNDYASSFGGTSHASPTIAGTAALVLSAFPLLSWDEAHEVIRRSAVRIDAGQNNAVGRYVDTDGDGVADFSQWYGSGRVDVNGAVREATKLAVAAFQAWS